MKKFGYDLDGILASCESAVTKDEVQNAESTSLELEKEVEVYLISYRPPWLRSETEEWLNQNGYVYDELILPEKILLTPSIDIAQARWKAEQINRLGLDVYYEDREVVRNILERRCSDTKIILAKAL